MNILTTNFPATFAYYKEKPDESKRFTAVTYFVDCSTHTIFETTSLVTALRFMEKEQAKDKGWVLRPYDPTHGEYDADLAEKRTRRRVDKTGTGPKRYQTPLGYIDDVPSMRKNPRKTR